MKYFIFMLLATLVVADVTEDCATIADKNTYYLFPGVVQNCYENYIISPEIPRAIIRTLHLIHDVYPFTDAAMKPPSGHEDYFKEWNFTSELENLTETLATSGNVASKVFPPTMRFIKGFRDSGFNLDVNQVDGLYENIFASVYAVIPFWWHVVVDGEERRVVADTPEGSFLGMSQADTMRYLFNEGYYIKTIDGIDAFEYLTNFISEFSYMKSPQGHLYQTLGYTTEGFEFPILSYPFDDLFASHTLVYSDEPSTTINYRFGFIHALGAQSTNRNKITEEMEVWKAIENFQNSSGSEYHDCVPCGSVAFNNGEVMNYIKITSFSPSFTYACDARLYVQELQECMSDFDENDNPIAVILADNAGGSVTLAALTQFLLMPKSDFRITAAMRKTELTEKIASDILKGFNFSLDTEKCDSDSNFTDFWKDTETDSFGDGVTHQRTKKTTLDFKSTMKKMYPYRLQKHVRKPTDIVVATDGYCLSECALFVDNVIRSGAGIVAGFGPTIPGEELFAAGQCPSISIDPAVLFPDELGNLSTLGLSFSTPIFETYDASGNDPYPRDYNIYLTDAHTGYTDEYVERSTTHTENLVNKTHDVYELFKTKCNPNNKRLIFVTDQCNSAKPNATLSGYACNDNGEWDTSACKVAACADGYVVDFKTDSCVLNPCDYRNYPEDSSGSKVPSSSSILRPVMSIIAVAFIVVYHLVH